MATVKNRADLETQSSDTFQDSPPANITPPNHRQFNEDFIASAATLKDRNVFEEQLVFAPQIGIDVVNTPLPNSLVFELAGSNNFVVDVTTPGIVVDNVIGKEGMWVVARFIDACEINQSCIEYSNYSGNLMIGEEDVFLFHFINDTKIKIVAEKRKYNNFFYVNDIASFQDIVGNNKLIPGFSYRISGLPYQPLQSSYGTIDVMVMAKNVNQFDCENVVAYAGTAAFRGRLDSTTYQFYLTDNQLWQNRIDQANYQGGDLSEPIQNVDIGTKIFFQNFPDKSGYNGNLYLDIIGATTNETLSRRNVLNYSNGGIIVGSIYEDPTINPNIAMNLAFLSDEGTQNSYGSCVFNGIFSPTVTPTDISDISFNSGKIENVSGFSSHYMVVNNMVHVQYTVEADFLGQPGNEINCYLPLPFPLNPAYISTPCAGVATVQHSPTFIAGHITVSSSEPLYSIFRAKTSGSVSGGILQASLIYPRI